METVNSEASLENATIQVQNSEDFKNLDLTKFSPKQIFGYNCTVCGKYYERKLYRLQQFDFELLCSKCSSKKHKKPWSEEKKRIAQEKRKQTYLERYGVETPLRSAKIQEKFTQTMLEKYGVEHPAQSKEIREKMKQTNLERYGVENPAHSRKIREKIKQTNLLRYGVDYHIQSEKVKGKIKQTNLAKYGVEYPLQSTKILGKLKQTNLLKYGVEYYFQSKEAQSKRKQVYRYEGTSFDSKPELAFYVYCKDHGIGIQRCTQRFDYEFKGKTRRYFPDFVVDRELVEIKGDQFLNEATNSWQNPFDHSQDPIYEAKHQCALRNNVKILYSRDYQKCIDYVLEKYGKNFFEDCGFSSPQS